MLVLPYNPPLSWRVIPWVTLTAVLLCVWMFLLQRHDGERMAEAVKIYAQSSLATQETPRYRVWLQTHTGADSMTRLLELDAALRQPHSVATTVRSIQSNPEFLRELRSGKVIKLDDPAYAQWREDRIRFETQFRYVVLHRLQLRADTGQPWRLLTYVWVHPGVMGLLLNMALLMLIGPFVEYTLGRVRFGAAYLLASGFSGGVHLAFNGDPLAGTANTVLALALVAAVHYRKRLVPTLLTVKRWSFKGVIPPAALLPLALLCAVLQVHLYDGEAASYWSLAAALIAGGVLATLLRPQEGVLPESSAGHPGDVQTERRQALARQARDAVMRMDTRRAVRLYRELVEDNPDHAGYLASYFNAALMAHDPELLSDASLRVLWMRNKGSGEELRKVFLQMCQPHVLQTLPVDEQLRLTRRLVRIREDAAALKVLDIILNSEQLRHLYGRQIADCLLGLFTTYTRYGLRTQASQVRARLKTYFPQPGTIGGLAPNTRAPSTLRRSSPGTTSPSTLFIDLS